MKVKMDLEKGSIKQSFKNSELLLVNFNETKLVLYIRAGHAINF